MKTTICAALACAAMTGAGLAFALPGAAMAQSAADREGVEAALYRYARGLDRLDEDLYASAWAEDGEFLLGATTYRGHEDMRQIVRDVAANRAAAAERGEPPRQLFHMDSNRWIEFRAPDHAVSHAYFFTVVRDGQGPGSTTEVIAAGSSEDELRKIGDEWVITRRTVSNEP